MSAESYKDYLAALQKRQERQLTKLRTKAAKVVEAMGIEKGHRQPRRVATMFFGDDRYQLCQEIGGESPQPIRLLKGCEPCRQEEPITDLEEGENFVPSAELARFCSDGKVFINGKRADPKQQYIIELPVIMAVLGLWGLSNTP